MSVFQTASVPADEWLTLFAAAKVAGCARTTLRAAVRRGDLLGYCRWCHRAFSLKELAGGHLCRVAPPKKTGHPMVFRLRDIKRFSVSPQHRAAGLESARARAKAR